MSIVLYKNSCTHNQGGECKLHEGLNCPFEDVSGCPDSHVSFPPSVLLENGYTKDPEKIGIKGIKESYTKEGEWGLDDFLVVEFWKRTRKIHIYYNCGLTHIKLDLLRPDNISIKEFNTLLDIAGLQNYKLADDTTANVKTMKMEERNECKKDILTLVSLIPCNEENESIINDIKNLLK